MVWGMDVLLNVSYPKQFLVTLNLEDQQEAGFLCLLDFRPWRRNMLKTCDDIYTNDSMAAVDFFTLLKYHWRGSGGGTQNLSPSDSHPDALRFGKQGRD